MTRPVPAKRLVLVDRTARDLLTDYIEAVDLVTPFAIPTAVSADPTMIKSSRQPSRPMPS